MSVRTFDSVEIKELFGMVKFHEKKLANALSDDATNTLIIAKTLNMALIANRIAYAVQYAKYQEPVFFNDITLDPVKLNRYFSEEFIDPIECKESELYEKLSLLDYNLYTNDGHIFLQDEYAKNIQKMINCLYKLDNNPIYDEKIIYSDDEAPGFISEKEFFKQGRANEL